MTTRTDFVLPFDARHYERRLNNLPNPDGRAKGYHKGQTERLVRDLIGENVKLMDEKARLVTERDAADEARRIHTADSIAARQPWEQNGGAPTMAIEAVVAGQQLAERHDRAANAEIARRLAAAETSLANARRAEEEAQRLLDEAMADVPALELPPEPKRSDDVPADLEARARYLAERKEMVQRHYEEALARLRQKLHDQEAELAGQERELLDRQSELLSEIDQIAEKLPTVRATVVDLTEAPSERAADEERVAS